VACVSNPTGTAYLNANQNYVWADGDVYEIPQSDLVEAAAAGASFGGLGVANQPHQFILNKIQRLHNMQLADEALLATLAGLLFASHVGATGWLKVAAHDVVLGDIQAIVQWGVINLPSPPNTNIGGDYSELMPFSFPISFPNAVLAASAQIMPDAGSNAMTTEPGSVLEAAAMIVQPWQLQNNQMLVSGEDFDFLYGQIGWFALGW
jgi:hypothetical protein